MDIFGILPFIDRVAAGAVPGGTTPLDFTQVETAKFEQVDQDQQNQALAVARRNVDSLKSTIKAASARNTPDELQKLVGQVRALKENIAPIETKSGTAGHLEKLTLSTDLVSMERDLTTDPARIQQLTNELGRLEHAQSGLDPHRSGFSAVEVTAEPSEAAKHDALLSMRDQAKLEVDKARGPAGTGVVPAHLQERCDRLETLVEIMQSGKLRHPGMEVPETLGAESLKPLEKSPQSEKVAAWVKANYFSDSADFSRSSNVKLGDLNLKVPHEAAQSLSNELAREFHPTDKFMRTALAKSLTSTALSSLSVAKTPELARATLRAHVLAGEFGIPATRGAYRKMVNELRAGLVREEGPLKAAQIENHLTQFSARHGDPDLSRWTTDLLRLHPEASSNEVAKAMLVEGLKYADQQMKAESPEGQGQGTVIPLPGAKATAQNARPSEPLSA